METPDDQIGFSGFCMKAGFQLILIKETGEEIISPIIHPPLSHISYDNGRILMLIAKIGKEITELDPDIKNWKARWTQNL